MGSTILVAGATGNTGRALVRRLARPGITVRAAARTRTRLFETGAMESGAIEAVVVEYDDPSSLARALRGVEKIYLAVPTTADLVHVTEQVVMAAVKAGVRHFVKLSGMGAAAGPDAVPDLQWGRWHRDAERVVESSGLAWTHLRPNSFMQNFTNNHLGSMRTHGVFYDPVGSGRVSYIDVEDIASVAAAVLTEPGHENQGYTLTGPEAVSSYQVASQFSLVAGREIRCIEVSVEAARDAMFGFGLPLAVVDAVTELYRAMRDGRQAIVTGTVSEVSGQPARNFAAFAADQQALFRG